MRASAPFGLIVVLLLIPAAGATQERLAMIRDDIEQEKRMLGESIEIGRAMYWQQVMKEYNLGEIELDVLIKVVANLSSIDAHLEKLGLSKLTRKA